MRPSNNRIKKCYTEILNNKKAHWINITVNKKNIITNQAFSDSKKCFELFIKYLLNIFHFTFSTPFFKFWFWVMFYNVHNISTVVEVDTHI